MATGPDTQMIVALLQAINTKVDNIVDQVISISTRIAIVESQKHEEKISDLRTTVDDLMSRLTIMETQTGSKDKIWVWLISLVTSIGAALAVKFLS